MHRRFFLLTSGLIAALGAFYYWPNRWRYIVIHHTAGPSGDLEMLTRVQQQRRPNDRFGIPYHFVIGNGRGMAMGEVAETERWQQMIWGAHVKGALRNSHGIGIALIGNFEIGPVPDEQFAALVALTRRLMAEHRIPAKNVTLHGKTPGEQSLCPGKNFPESRFFNAIANRNV